MTVDSITKAQWRVDDLARDLAHAQQSLSLARSEVETTTEQLKGAKAALAQLRRAS
jgi:hypothetical protein